MLKQAVRADGVVLKRRPPQIACFLDSPAYAYTETERMNPTD